MVLYHNIVAWLVHTSRLQSYMWTSTLAYHVENVNVFVCTMPSSHANSSLKWLKATTPHRHFRDTALH